MFQASGESQQDHKHEKDPHRDWTALLQFLKSVSLHKHPPLINLAYIFEAEKKPAAF